MNLGLLHFVAATLAAPLVQTMNVDPRLMKPTVDASLLALGILATARNVGDPPSQIDLPSLDQRDDHL